MTFLGRVASLPGPRAWPAPSGRCWRHLLSYQWWEGPVLITSPVRRFGINNHLFIAASTSSTQTGTDTTLLSSSVNNLSSSKCMPEVLRHFSSSETSAEKSTNSEEDEEKNLTLFQRFMATYKRHGKTLIAVHVATSIVWFGSFYYIASSGFDVVSWLEYYELSESIISPFKHSGLGDVAIMYLMYKLATPLRYTVTLGGTNMAIRYLKSTGYIQPISREDSLRALMKDGSDIFKEKKSVLIKESREKIKVSKEKMRSLKNTEKDNSHGG